MQKDGSGTGHGGITLIVKEELGVRSLYRETLFTTVQLIAWLSTGRGRRALTRHGSTHTSS